MVVTEGMSLRQATKKIGVSAKLFNVALEVA